ncbi:hypothetical protein F5X99DRAFT_414534 [Biscogniauxia marginata]|nr:hypothetical protein F5X99DRAFT_414534 [Biscogniauxia marginata]
MVQNGQLPNGINFVPAPNQIAGMLQWANGAPVNDRSDDPVVCVVCGGICLCTMAEAPPGWVPKRRNWMYPMLIMAKPEYHEWCKLPSSAKAYNRQDDHLFRELAVDVFRGGADGFEVPELGQISIDTSHSEIAIPIHPACLALAKSFCRYQSRFDIDFRSPKGGEPSSLAHLYEIWCKRAIATCPHGLMTEPIREPHDYFGAPCPYDLFPFYNNLSLDPTIRMYEVDPIDVPCITHLVILNNLQSMKGKETKPTPKLAECRERIKQMPQEIHDRIIEAIEPFEDGLGKKCLEPTRILPSTWWKEKLMSGQLIPWLGDFNNTEVIRFRQRQNMSPSEVFDEDNWDWELLCRQLAQPDVLEEGGVLHDVSLHLWNRHRIWKLLDSARLGHFWRLRF